MCKQGIVINAATFCRDIKRRNVIEMTICVHTIKVTPLGTVALPKTGGQLSIYQQGKLFW